LFNFFIIEKFFLIFLLQMSRKRSETPVEGSPIISPTLDQDTPNAGDKSSASNAAQKAARLAQIEEEILDAQILKREAELDVLRLESARASERADVLRAAPPLHSDPSDLNRRSSDKNSSHPEKSSAIIKETEKRLVQNLLADSAPKTSITWLQELAVYIDYGGKQSPWDFLHPTRRRAFDRFLSTTSHKKTICDHYYKDLVYDSSSECSFLNDYTRFIISENRLKPSDYLKSCAMAPCSTFDATKIRNYIDNMCVTITMFDDLRPSLAVHALVEGLQPYSFRNFVTSSYKEIYSGTWDHALEVIIEAYEDTEDFERKKSKGFDAIGRPAKNRAGNDKTRSNEAAATPSRLKQKPVNDLIADKTGKSDDTKGPYCNNCKTKGHTIANCEHDCTRCVPPCGERPNKCPVFLRARDTLSPKPLERGKQLERAYKTNNARASSASGSSKKGSSQVPHISSQISSPKSYAGCRPAKRVSWSTPLTTTAMIPGPSSPDNLLIDFGCNGNFL